ATHVAEGYARSTHGGERACAEIDDIRRAVDDDGIRRLRAFGVEVRAALRSQQHYVNVVRRYDALRAQQIRHDPLCGTECTDAQTRLDPVAAIHRVPCSMRTS